MPNKLFPEELGPYYLPESELCRFFCSAPQLPQPQLDWFFFRASFLRGVMLETLPISPNTHRLSWVAHTAVLIHFIQHCSSSPHRSPTSHSPSNDPNVHFSIPFSLCTVSPRRSSLAVRTTTSTRRRRSGGWTSAWSSTPTAGVSTAPKPLTFFFVLRPETAFSLPCFLLCVAV